MQFRMNTHKVPEARIGLDAEALSGPEWADTTNYSTRLAVCFGIGYEGSLEYVEAEDMTPGVFRTVNLEFLARVVSQPGAIIVAHNANYDLDLLNGTLLDHDMDPLPPIRYQDTMNTLKHGRAYRNTLEARCIAMDINLKSGSPNWRAVLQRKREAWDEMREYNLNDVVCALQLEEAYRVRGLPCPIKTWYPRRDP